MINIYYVFIYSNNLAQAVLFVVCTYVLRLFISFSINTEYYFVFCDAEDVYFFRIYNMAITQYYVGGIPGPTDTCR